MHEESAIRAAARSIPKWEFVALAAALMSLNALAVNIMLPGMDQIASDLGAGEENRRQFVITAYMAGMAAALLPYGPASDRFGRRGPMLFGLSVYVAASIAAIFASSFEALLTLRFLQGLGAAATRVIVVAMVRGRFSGRAMAETMSLVMTVFMTVPVLAPLLGQAALQAGDWRAIFIATGLAGALVAGWLALRLPETQDPASRRPFTLNAVVGGFGAVLSHRAAVLYILASSLMFGALYGFINSSQQIFVDVFGLGSWFPIVFASVSGMMALASFLNSRLVRRFGMRRLSHGALAGFVAVSLAWWGTTLVGDPPLWLFLAFVTFAMMQFGLVTSNFNALVMEPLGRVAGAGAALQGFVQTFGGALIGTIIGQAFDETTGPLAGGFLGVGIAALICVALAEGGRLFAEPAA